MLLGHWLRFKTTQVLLESSFHLYWHHHEPQCSYISMEDNDTKIANQHIKKAASYRIYFLTWYHYLNSQFELWYALSQPGPCGCPYFHPLSLGKMISILLLDLRWISLLLIQASPQEDASELRLRTCQSQRLIMSPSNLAEWLWAPCLLSLWLCLLMYNIVWRW